MNRASAAILALVVALAAPSANALEWRLGLSYASGVKDVTDLYEDNLEAAGLTADVDLKFPIGISLGVTQDWESGLRADFGLGPAFFIEGDVDYFELPLIATVGYNFAQGSRISPYVRAGVAYHAGSGDFHESTDPGLYVAAGIDFTRLAVEIAFDTTKVEFENTCAAGAVDCDDRRKLSTYDVIVSAFWRFY